MTPPAMALPRSLPAGVRGPVRARLAWLVLLAVALVAAGCADQVPSPSAAGRSPSPGVTASAPASARPSPVASPTQPPSATPSAGPSSSPGSGISGASRVDCPGKNVSARRGAVSTGLSRNWAGYIVGATRGHVTCVEGTWVQPTVKCPASGIASVAIWVGIDGTTAAGSIPDASATLAQTGTVGDCAEGKLQLSTWYEFLPDLRQEMPLNVPVSAGDRIWAQVLSLGKGAFQATLINLTQNVGAVQDWTLRNPPLLTAEWVAEAPASRCASGSCTVLPLARFSTLTMDGYATVNSRRYRVTAVPYPYLRVSISHNGKTLAAPSSLGSKGFTVTWKGS